MPPDQTARSATTAKVARTASPVEISHSVLGQIHSVCLTTGGGILLSTRIVESDPREQISRQSSSYAGANIGRKEFQEGCTPGGNGRVGLGISPASHLVQWLSAASQVWTASWYGRTSSQVSSPYKRPPPVVYELRSVKKMPIVTTTQSQIMMLVKTIRIAVSLTFQNLPTRLKMFVNKIRTGVGSTLRNLTDAHQPTSVAVEFANRQLSG